MTVPASTRPVHHSVSQAAQNGEPRARSSSSSAGPRIEPYRPSLLPASSDISITRTHNHRDVAVAFSGSHILHAKLDRRADSSAIVLRVQDLDPGALIHPVVAQRAVWNAVFPFFETGKDAPKEVTIELALPSNVLHDALVALGARHTPPSYVLSRATIFSSFAQWAFATPSSSSSAAVSTTTSSVSDGHRTSSVANGQSVEHPVRPTKPEPGSVIYSRLVPHLTEYFQLAVVAQKDVPVLHEWMNDPRVAANWMEDGDIAKHEKFVADGIANPASMPVIGSYVPQKGGEPQQAIYSEIYWVKEDRLGPLLPEPCGEYDRGIHQLVGSNAHRGPHRVRAWLPSLAHYCFTAEPRTQRVYCEPNQLNEKMINYLKEVGFEQHGTVTFPHKTSALMILERERFHDLLPL